MEVGLARLIVMRLTVASAIRVRVEEVEAVVVEIVVVGKAVEVAQIVQVEVLVRTTYRLRKLVFLVRELWS